jgi:hypothetical protein
METSGQPAAQHLGPYTRETPDLAFAKSGVFGL